MMPIRVLIINTNLAFSVRIKQAMEKIGGYEVVSFTSAQPAFDILAERPFDVVLLDFYISSIPAMDVILRLRSLQPDIGIIAGPNLPEVAAIVKDLELNGLIDMPCTVRDLMPIVHQAVHHKYDTLPDTTETPVLGSDSETLLIDAKSDDTPSPFSSLDSVLVRMGGFEVLEGADTVDVDMSDAEHDGPRNIELVLTGSYSELREDSDEVIGEESLEERELFRQLAEEEPPMPSLEESGTISELRLGVGIVTPEQLESAMKVAPLAFNDSDIEDDSGSNPAEVVLQAALDDSLTLEGLVNNLIEQFPVNEAGIKPLPSWMQDVERYVREPDFLSIELPQLDQTDYGLMQTTIMSHPEEIQEYPGDMETDRITDGNLKSEYEIYITTDDVEDTTRATVSPQPDVVIPPVDLPEMNLGEEHKTELQELPPYEFDSQEIEHEVIDQADEESEDLGSYFDGQAQFNEPSPLPIVHDVGDKVTRLALSLTQVSLESTAEATILVDNGEIIAHVGNMPFEDILELEANIEADWNAQEGEARIRFVTLPSNGQDYMLYSRLTMEGLTLAMIFAGNMPLRVIRRQSERLVSALNVTSGLVQDADDNMLEETFAEDDLQHLAEVAEMEHEAILHSTAELQAVVDSGLAIPSITSSELDSVPSYKGPLESHTYLWTIRNSQQTLVPAAMEAIFNELQNVLRAMGWGVNSLAVTQEYVCLFADAPADKPGQTFIPDLKQRSALIAQRIDTSIDLDMLWSDGYAVLTPGRKMTEVEIQQFIAFERMIQ